MEFLVIIGLFVVGAIVWGILQGQANSDKASKIKKEIESNYPESKIFVSESDRSFISVDFKKQCIFLGLKEQRGGLFDMEEPYQNEYKFSDLVQVEVVKDGTTVSSTNRGSQAVGAAVGAAAFGGLGALIGGLSGSSTSRERIRRITLRVKVDDQDRPVHDITMFFWDVDKKGVKADNRMLKPALKSTETFATHVVNAMRQAAANSTPNGEMQKISTSERIKDLWDLKEKGALTDEEFESEKTKILKE